MFFHADESSKPVRYWRQLSGAVAMLVLLGVPWLFSAFGAVDHDASQALKITEAAFQVRIDKRSYVTNVHNK